MVVFASGAFFFPSYQGLRVSQVLIFRATFSQPPTAVRNAKQMSPQTGELKPRNPVSIELSYIAVMIGGGGALLQP